MASCPRCFHEKEMFATRCPHCVADVPIGKQVKHSFLLSCIFYGTFVLAGWWLLGKING